MRGEHVYSAIHVIQGQGSPPHARGTHSDYAGKVLKTRITPACAGNTFIPPFINFAPKDHPRMRGEHLGDWEEKPLIVGSPPHARGTHKVATELGCSVRITPACAGTPVD